MGDLKRFDDYSEVVDCNECARYWDSSCDGVSKDSKRPCNSYLATRSVVIPARLNDLEKRVKWLAMSNIAGFVLITLLSMIVGWLIG